jgi:PmbA protein
VSDAATLLEKARETVRRGRRIGADAIEVFATAEREAKVHLEADDLGVAYTHEEERFGIRVRLRGASGFASTNDASSDARDEAVRAALAVAAVSPPDPFDELPPPSRTVSIAGLRDPALEELDVETIGKLCAELATRARDLDGRVKIDSGWISCSAQTTAIATSTGIGLSERTTQADALIFGMAVEGARVGSFDSEQAAVCSLAEFRTELESLPRRWVARVTSSLAAGSGETFRGTLVLTPEAVAGFLLPALVGSLSAQAVRMGRSRFADKLGQATFSPSISLLDDGTLPGRPASASFDREGVPHRPLALIERGELRSFLWNTREARAASRAEGSTGHAAGGSRAAPGIGPTSLVVAEGDQDDDALVRGVERGILLSRFSGNTDPVSGDFSGVAKGSFLLRAGEAPRPIQETLISGNLYELLASVSGVGRARRWIDGSVLAPRVRLEGVSVTSG